MDAIARRRRHVARDDSPLPELEEGPGAREVLEEAPPLPQATQDNNTSPFDVEEGQAFVAQVQSAQVFLTWCRATIHRYDALAQRSPPEVQDEIEKLLREIAGKVQQGARVQAIGEASVEVAAHVRMSLK